MAALEREVRPLIRNWRASDKEHDGRRFRFFESGDTVVVCGGIGTAAARRAAEAVISLFDPHLVCSAGFAGALDPKLRIGDLIRPAAVINANDGSRTTVHDGKGVLVSFASVAGPNQKRKLRESFQAEIVDMEAAAVARSAEVHGRQFIALKAVSDDTDFEFPPMERFVNADGEFSEAKFAVFAAVRPWLWARVIRLARNGSKASLTLCEHLSREILRSASLRSPPA